MRKNSKMCAIKEIPKSVDGSLGFNSLFYVNPFRKIRKSSVRWVKGIGRELADQLVLVSNSNLIRLLLPATLQMSVGESKSEVKETRNGWKLRWGSDREGGSASPAWVVSCNNFRKLSRLIKWNSLGLLKDYIKISTLFVLSSFCFVFTALSPQPSQKEEKYSITYTENGIFMFYFLCLPLYYFFSCLPLDP